MAKKMSDYSGVRTASDRANAAAAFWRQKGREEAEAEAASKPWCTCTEDQRLAGETVRRQEAARKEVQGPGVTGA